MESIAMAQLIRTLVWELRSRGQADGGGAGGRCTVFRRGLRDMLGHMGVCHNCGPLLGPLNTRCRIILRPQKRTIVWITTHI